MWKDRERRELCTFLRFQDTSTNELLHRLLTNEYPALAFEHPRKCLCLHVRCSLTDQADVFGLDPFIFELLQVDDASGAWSWKGCGDASWRGLRSLTDKNGTDRSPC